MKLVLISDPSPVAQESFIINSLFKAGLMHFNLRKPLSSRSEVEILMDGIEPRYYSRISIHQYHELAPIYGLKRIHYTEKARQEAAFLKLLEQKEEGYVLSTSIHHLSTLGSMGNFDSVFYGPVFNSLSKPGYKSRLDPSFFLDKGEVRTEVIALGGISPVNLSKVCKMNFDGAAVLGTIWNDPEFALESFTLLKNSIPLTSTI